LGDPRALAGEQREKAERETLEAAVLFIIDDAGVVDFDQSDSTAELLLSFFFFLSFFFDGDDDGGGGGLFGFFRLLFLLPFLGRLHQQRGSSGRALGARFWLRRLVRRRWFDFCL